MNENKHSVPVSHCRKRLGAWQIALALLLGLGAWWSVGVYSEPRPIWTVRFSSPKDIMLPMCENMDGDRIGAYEVKLPPLQTSNSTTTAISILDARNGTTLYRLPLEDANWNPQVSHWAQPRIIGDVLWRIAKTTSDSTTCFELRAWDFAQSKQEKVIHTWKDSSTSSFEIAFADSTSPYFITQTDEPWEPLLIGMGVDGWSRLLAAMAFTQQPEVMGAAISSRSPMFSFKRGLMLPKIQTWKLPSSLDSPLEQIAAWKMPPLRIAWPPACAPDLQWVAFGDFEAYGEWNVDQINNSIKPQGILLFDGRTGAPRTVNAHGNEAMRVSTAGELLLVTSNRYIYTPIVGTSEHTVYDGNTSRQLNWPVEVNHPFTPSDLQPYSSQPGRYLALMGMLTDPYSTSRTITEGDQHIYHLQRTEQGFDLVKDITIRTQPGQMLLYTAHISGSELGVYATVDHVPLFLRPLIEKWDWFKTYARKIWPRNVPALILYDLETGNEVRQFRQVVPFTRPSGMKLQFTLDYPTDSQPGSLECLSLAAWQLPIHAKTLSPWWSRGSGLVVFALILLFLRRRA